MAVVFADCVPFSNLLILNFVFTNPSSILHWRMVESLEHVNKPCFLFQSIQLMSCSPGVGLGSSSTDSTLACVME